MIFETAEFRWFWVTNDLPALIAWFADDASDSAGIVETRTDHYLQLPGCQGTGVKLRDGRLEVKALVADQGMYVLHAGLCGRLQRWVKWSQDGPADRKASAAGSNDWLRVTKSRRLRRVSVNGMPEAEAVSHFELTSLCVPRSAENWVTFGIESDAAVPDPRGVLCRAARHFFRHRPQIPDELLRAASLSYPEWIAVTE